MMLCIEDALRGDNRALSKYKHMPVDVRTFIEADYYMQSVTATGQKIIYPEVMKHLVEINEGDYDEVVLTGGIGAAKSTIGVYTQAYQLYLLSCMADPQGYFGLDPSSEIVIVFQSLSKTLAEEVDYDRFRSMVERTQYFQEKFPHNKFVENQLEFPNRIIVKPISGLETGAISQNVIGGMIDEVNFMAVVEKSKMADGGTYDQATALYNSIARRRKSRFLKAGRMPGRLCLVSSRRTPGQFTDKKEEEAKSNPKIYVYDKRVWEIKPPGTFSNERFHIFIGDGARQPRVIADGEIISEDDRHLIDAIPIEFRADFTDDITKALRDIAGKSTLAIHPFMPRREDVAANFGRRPSVFTVEVFNQQGLKLRIRDNLVIRNPDCPRWVHIDLGISSDSAGLVIAHVPKFMEMKRGEGTEYLPVIEVDGALEIPPPPGKRGEIDFAGIRRILYKLRDMGMQIKWVSLDSFQSTDTMQILRRNGFIVGYQSIDTTNVPYDLTKQALYDHRVIAPAHEKLVKELVSLERDFRRGKVDHPAKGSKDIADSLAGVIFGLSMRRDVWAQHRIPLSQAVSIASHINDHEDSRSIPRE
jgi:hypothetical protein